MYEHTLDLAIFALDCRATFELTRDGDPILTNVYVEGLGDMAFEDAAILAPDGATTPLRQWLEDKAQAHAATWLDGELWTERGEQAEFARSA